MGFKDESDMTIPSTLVLIILFMALFGAIGYAVHSVGQHEGIEEKLK